MSVELALIKEPGRLVPVDEVSSDDLMAIPNGTEVLVSPRMPRSLRQHRFVWALAQKLAENCAFLRDRQEAMDYLKVKAKHVRLVTAPDGSFYVFPRSIAFASMSQVAFTQLLNKMIDVICGEILPGLEEQDLRNEVSEMIYFERPARMIQPHPRPQLIHVR